MKTSHYILAVVSGISLFTGHAGAQTGPLDQWTARNSGTTGHLLAVAYGNGTFVAVGGLPPFNPSDPIHPSLLSSTNGIIWNSLPMPTNANFYGVSFVNNRFIAVGNSGLIMSSEDAISWTVQKSSAANQTSDI